MMNTKEILNMNINCIFNYYIKYETINQKR